MLKFPKISQFLPLNGLEIGQFLHSLAATTYTFHVFKGNVTSSLEKQSEGTAGKTERLLLLSGIGLSGCHEFGVRQRWK